MGLFRYNFDADVLRAIAYARLQIASGYGLETVIHSMATADLGLVSEALVTPMALMTAGQATTDALQAELKRVPNPRYGELLTALMAEGEAAIRRMDELSEDIQGDRRVKVEQYAKLLDGRLKFTTILFLMTFVPCFLQVCAEVPENDIVPSFNMSPTFYWTFFSFFGMVLAGLVLSMKYRE